MHRTLTRLSFSLTFVFGALLSASAQNASISGEVTDPHHAVVANAEVQVINQQTTDKITTKTDQVGKYKAQPLPPGQYKVVVKAPGFSHPEAADITLAEGQAIIHDVQLTLALVGSTVSVQGESRVEYVENLGPLTDRLAINTPYTTYTLTEDMLENAFVTNPFMVERLAPGTGIDDFARASQISFVGFRGIAGVMLVNGIRQADTSGVFAENTGAVQMLLGYSSFLYGMSSIGGLEDYQLKRPAQKSFTNITLNDVETRGFNGSVDQNGSFKNGLFGYRVNLMGQDGGTAVDDQDFKKYLTSLAFDFKPIDRLQIHTDVYKGESRLDGLQPGFYSGGYPILLPLLDPHHLWGPQSSFSDVKTLYVSAGANLKLNNIFSIRTAWDHKDSETKGSYLYNNNIDFNATNTAPVDYNLVSYGSASKPYNDGYYTYLDGKFKTFGIDHSFFGGINGYSGHSRSPLYGSSTGVTTSLPQATSANYAWGDYRSPLSWSTPNYFSSLLGYAKSGTNSIYSLIFGDTVNLGRHFSAIGGLDYAHVKTANYNALTGVRGSHYDEGSLSPSASVLYKPISNLTAYFTYMQSVTPGQVVGTTYQNANAVLPPFKNYEYEEGVKYQLPKGALLTVAWYRLDIESTLSSDGTNHGILEETGREIHNGLDTSISGKITNSLVLMGGYSYIDAKLTKQNPAILDGQQPSEVPPNLWKMTVEYQPSFVKNLFVTGGTYFNGASYSTNIYAPGGYNVLYPGYVQVDLGARYARRFDKVQTIYRLNIMNLNNSYQTSYGDFNHARSVNFGSTISF